MFKSILHIVFFLLFIQSGIGQVRIVKPVQKVKLHPGKTNLAFSAGIIRSVLFLTRNIKENNDAYGYQGAVLYGGEKLLRGSLEYSYYRKINIEPTWYNVKAYTIEANVHFLARFKKTKAYFYPLCGISYNSFSGYFTGLDDFLNLSDKYKKNQTVRTNWLGLNVGAGYEQFFKRVSIFGEYKMRVGDSNGKSQLNIMDVCFNLGVRYSIRVPSFYKIFSGTKSRYLLESKPAED